MNNTQLYLSIGVPSFLVILAWLSSRTDIQKMGDRIDCMSERINQVRQKLVVLRRDIQADLTRGLNGVRGEMIAFRREMHADMIPLYERVAVMEAPIDKKKLERARNSDAGRHEAMKQFEWKWNGGLVGLILGVLAFVHPVALRAQEATATVHGHVINPAGSPLNGGEIRLTTDKTSEAKNRKFAYTFPIDATGNYKGAGIKAENYVAIVFQGEKSLDFNDSVVFKPGEDKTVDFDMTRKEYMDKMSPEDRKALEEYKKKNAEVTNANKTIGNLNALLTQARADNKAGNYDSAITAMQQATTQKADEGILWVTLGDAQLGSADTAAKALKASGKPLASDATVTGKYNDAIASYKKAVDLNAASKKPSPETAAAAYNQTGQAYGKMGDVKNASDAYDSAAKAQPTSAGMYYFNEAATLYNAGKPDDAGAAADKAIAADPKRADAYYIKAQSLIPKASVDPKTQKITAPPGCVEAYQQYLELAPDGPHAQEVKDILTGIGATVKSSYKAGKK